MRRDARQGTAPGAGDQMRVFFSLYCKVDLSIDRTHEAAASVVDPYAQYSPCLLLHACTQRIDRCRRTQFELPRARAMEPALATSHSVHKKQYDESPASML
jgi:hypothetical protein